MVDGNMYGEDVEAVEVEKGGGCVVREVEVVGEGG